MCGIDGFPNHCALQICKRFPTKLFSFQEPIRFVDLIDLQNRLKIRFFHANQVQKSWSRISLKLIIVAVNHLHICHGR